MEVSYSLAQVVPEIRNDDQYQGPPGLPRVAAVEDQIAPAWPL